MSVKDTVLRLLEERKGTRVSGQWLARESGASRTAVWKAVRALVQEGYPVDASPNRGYCLASASDLLSAAGIGSRCRCLPPDRLFVYKELDSTNSVAKRLLADHREPPFLVTADAQTEGRGRMGRRFHSPSGSGIYMSLALRPAMDVSRSVLVTTAASVAVCRAIQEVLGLSCQIKWVNDIYLEGKKVCGILTEGMTSFETGSVDALIIGIGMNYRMPEESFPEELLGTAGALLDLPDFSTGPEHPSVSRNHLIAAVVDHLMALVDPLDSRNFMDEYRRRSLILGRDIRFTDASRRDRQAREGRVEAIDDSGALLIRTPEGEALLLNSGEITVRPV